MRGVTPAQQLDLNGIAESLRVTDLGRNWPPEYQSFSAAWGYFNSVYNTLYTDPSEPRRIALFSIDSRFTPLWTTIRRMQATRDLAKLPCVGNGKASFRPSVQIQIAFHTLRTEYGFSINTPCRRKKCNQRRRAGWPTCMLTAWPPVPAAIVSPEDAKFTPLGATLAITYQIRNNLFHGSKMEYIGPEFERNRKLVTISDDIIRAIMRGVEQLV